MKGVLPANENHNINAYKNIVKLSHLFLILGDTAKLRCILKNVVNFMISNCIGKCTGVC